MKVAVLCGGPSLERGISLNSARSVLDHLSCDEIEIVPIYFNTAKQAYKISSAQLYCNTPSDFDFKLKQTSQPLTDKGLLKVLNETDIVFPVIHGQFGEGGNLQNFLEKNQIPFVGSGSGACKLAFDKFIANQAIAKQGFFTLPSAVLKIFHRDHKKIINNFFREHSITRAVVKPASGGSSIGVFSVSTPKEALQKTTHLFSKRMDTRVVVEPFARGTEFTIIILENRFGLPVALPPTEIQTDYTQHQIFDFRKKYLPTRQVTWHCPSRFDDKIIDKIQAQAEQIFSLFKMRDFARFDGWILPDGQIWFCDFNPISGMEQNSFLFQQASRVGLTHAGVLRQILSSACRRQNINFPSIRAIEKEIKRKKINVIFGGQTSERQISLMSGTNVWLKLRGSKKYQPQPFLLDKKGNIWRLPYQLALNHTVEEIAKNCEQYKATKCRLKNFEERSRMRLGLPEKNIDGEFGEPQKTTLKNFIKNSKFVFIALHGGLGEDGRLQKILSGAGVKFNGSDERVSWLCMDKWATAEKIKSLQIDNFFTIPNKLVKTSDFLSLKNYQLKPFWKNLKKKLGAKTIIAKPRADGCSTGVVHLYSLADLEQYQQIFLNQLLSIPKNTFKNQTNPIEMPISEPTDLLFESFIETDLLKVKNNRLKHLQKTGWLETTIGVVEENKKIHAFNPSLTIVGGEVLSVEEKFQGGTGVNITPPPNSLMKPSLIKKVKLHLEELAAKIGLNGYARIDAFMNIKTGKLLIIEVNNLPALTPSTVFYQQGLAEDPPVFPRELLEKIIENAGY